MADKFEICDICGNVIVPNVDACYGGCDTPRHYDCHVSKHGIPDPFGIRKLRELRSDIDRIDRGMKEAFGSLRGAIDREDRRRAADVDFDKLDRTEFTKKRDS